MAIMYGLCVCVCVFLFTCMCPGFVFLVRGQGFFLRRDRGQTQNYFIFFALVCSSFILAFLLYTIRCTVMDENDAYYITHRTAMRVD